MSTARKIPVAIVSREDFERMKRKSVKISNTPMTQEKPQEQPKMPLATRKPLPKSMEPSEKDLVIISRAEIAKQEELTEIRRANRIILTAKCNLIRSAQIAEKNELKRELNEEENRHYELMEKERQEEFRRIALENEEKERVNKQHAEMIKRQLELRANERQKQADKIKAEADYLVVMELKLRASNDYVAKQKEIQRDKLKAELQSAYEINQKIKSMNFERERLSELKIQEYMRQKKNREEALDAEKRLRNDCRERKMLKMCEDQMQTRNSQDEKYEKWFQREAERKEREFRRKELEAAKKKKGFDAAVLEDRKMQQREKKRLRDLEQERLEREYQENLRLHNEALQRDKQLDCSKRKQKEYCDMIKEQMRIKEQQRKMDRRKSQSDLEELQSKEQQRKSKIDRVLSEKLQELKLSHVPEKLIKDVERRIKRVTSS